MNKLHNLIKSLPLILFILGLISFVVAGLLFNLIIGLVVLGLCLLILGYFISPMPNKGGY